MKKLLLLCLIVSGCDVGPRDSTHHVIHTIDIQGLQLSIEDMCTAAYPEDEAARTKCVTDTIQAFMNMTMTPGMGK